MSELPYAESVNYFGTSTTAPDSWIERTVKIIQGMGGVVTGHAFGGDPSTGRAAFMIAFYHGQERFRIVWPVLPVRNSKHERAAKIQAATLLYHDVKGKLIKAKIFGMKSAFFEHWLLPDGRAVVNVAAPELYEAFAPGFLLGGGNE